MNILIVEDSANQRLLLEHYLKKGAVGNTLLAENAHEAFQYLGLEESHLSCQVDLILMDIVMPAMNGIEAVGRIKAVKELADIPIIMVTGLQDIENLELAFEAGCNDYLVKPVKPLELLARVRTSLKLKSEIDTRKARERELVLEIEERKKVEKAREELIKDLKKALSQVKTLEGMLPICANCKKIRDDGGYWSRIETYITQHSGVDFTHSICPDCAKELYPEFTLYKDE